MLITQNKKVKTSKKYTRGQDPTIYIFNFLKPLIFFFILWAQVFSPAGMSLYHIHAASAFDSMGL